MENKQLTVIDYNNKEIIAKLQATVARGTTPEEFWLFCERCKATKLNPLTNEIWCIKTEGYTNKRGDWVDGRMQIMIGINGFQSIANSNPEFDGMETTVQLTEQGKPLSATCKVYRKDRKYPHVCTVYFNEYYRAGFNGKPSNWDKMPVTMIEKVAKSRAIREAFPQVLNDIYIEEELDNSNQQEPIEPDYKYYDLAKYDAEKQPIAIEYCKKNQFEFLSDTLIRVKAEVAKLSSCAVTKEEALGTQNFSDDAIGGEIVPEKKPVQVDRLAAIKKKINEKQLGAN